MDRLDISLVLAKLPKLSELTLSYTMKDCGMNFEWILFQFTGKDCLNLSRGVRAHSNLRVLVLTQSRVDCERCRVLVSHLLDHSTLQVLDLSHNLIADRGGRALGKLLNGRCQLVSLRLANNWLHGPGGQALAHALSKPACKLIELNLRLNRMQDDGGVAIGKVEYIL
ncbi:unnamed protein product [Protopolystoma xenopodis]|uniref:Uncharacterized protein n=1 Tax=Protopolystoma xenopodis TaxID=117903 RepID=A0A448XG94_9PLAT|nr:unnamed protein product [Protopolystoma xenopodis]